MPDDREAAERLDAITKMLAIFGYALQPFVDPVHGKFQIMDMRDGSIVGPPMSVKAAADWFIKRIESKAPEAARKLAEQKVAGNA